MRLTFRFLFPLSVILCVPSPARAAESVDFSREVLPILSSNCLRCHGHDPGSRHAELRLDLRDHALLRRKDGSFPVVPGQPEHSEMIARVTSDDDNYRMPPPDEGRALSPREIATLRDWIAQGASYAEHWAYQPLAAHRVASVDEFVRARLAQEKLPSAPPASRLAFVRRASLDLLGLLPTPEEVASFVGDKSSDDEAFAHLVDRLLASPHYGERYGRHWLDVARYADSSGYARGRFYSHAWRYRDYVIRSFNADKPFNRFVAEQIAADELFPGDAEARVATGLYTVGPLPNEPGMDQARRDYEQNVDFVDTTGSAFLGLTLGCARCHDHKFDPISQKEYFALHAVFAASDQIDYSVTGEKIREHAAAKTTLIEFAAEQARSWLDRAESPERHTELLQQIGDAYLGIDGRYDRTLRHQRIQRALDTYQQKKLLPDIRGTLQDDDDDDNETAALKAELRGLMADGPADSADAAFFRVGIVALFNPSPLPSAALPSGTADDPSLGSRAKFAGQTTGAAKIRYLVDLGRRQIDRPRPDGFVDDAEALRAQLGRQHLGDPSPIPVRALGHRAVPLETRLLKRGELSLPGEVVSAGLPERFAAGFSLAGVPADHRRAVLADWIASDKNLLTARVIANRVWQWHFGEGLVRTPDDFGIRGERPSHPELLDWLAGELVAHGWSLKHLHRLIMNSATYRQAATVDPQTLARDPDNQLLTRFQPYRLEAEVIWDNLRRAAGTLSPRMFGLPVTPPLDAEERFSGGAQFPDPPPDEAQRRALYFLARRSFRLPMLGSFDTPFSFTTCGRREISTTPTQALTLLNQPQVRAQAAAFADRLLRETRRQLAPVPALAWRYAYARDITPEERNAAAALMLQSRDPATGALDATAAVTNLCHALFNTNEFIYQQ